MYIVNAAAGKAKVPMPNIKCWWRNMQQRLSCFVPGVIVMPALLLNNTYICSIPVKCMLSYSTEDRYLLTMPGYLVILPLVAIHNRLYISICQKVTKW